MILGIPNDKKTDICRVLSTILRDMDDKMSEALPDRREAKVLMASTKTSRFYHSFSSFVTSISTGTG